MKGRKASVVKRSVGLILVAVMIVAVISPTSAQTTRFFLNKIIEIGDQAPGFEPGSRVNSIEDVPRMDSQGNSSFVLSVRNSAGALQTGIYRHANGQTSLAFKTGDPAPGTSPGTFFTGFPNVFAQTPRIENGSLTFPANISGDNALFGIWSDLFGTFSLQVLQGNRLPGMPTDGELFDLTFTTNRNHIFLNGEWSTPTQTNPADEGLWRNSTGQWQTILIRGMQAPGFDPGVVFDADPLNVFGPMFTFRTRANGKVLAQVWVDGPQITDENNEALMVETDQGLVTLVREGARAPVSGPGRTHSDRQPAYEHSEAIMRILSPRSVITPRSSSGRSYGPTRESYIPSGRTVMETYSFWRPGRCRSLVMRKEIRRPGSLPVFASRHLSQAPSTIRAQSLFSAVPMSPAMLMR